jgi:hypothetical protein
MTGRKAWILQSPEERNNTAVEAREDTGLLAAGIYAAMQKNEGLREEVLRLQKNLDDAVHLIETLNAKIAILSTLNKHGTGQNPSPTPTPKN